MTSTPDAVSRHRPEGGAPTAGAEVELSLTGTPEAAARARAFVTDTLVDWGFRDHIVDDAVLLTSELVGNAVRHCRGRTTVKLVRSRTRLRVEVCDDEARAPVLHSEFATDAETGRGLQLVDQLSLSWGWQPVGPGKQVWFELPRA
jgi:anti-sigma regulatory factor (Ser/Thr protein kinase)